MPQFLLSNSTIHTQPHRQALQSVQAGGYVSFEGWVRDHHLGKNVAALDYEAYEGLALKQGNSVLKAAREQFDIIDALAVHRTGSLAPGDLAIWIGVTAEHRASAFAACRYLIDEIKATVPIWKHEFYVDGSEVWVNPTDCHCVQEKEYRQ